MMLLQIIILFFLPQQAIADEFDLKKYEVTKKRVEEYLDELRDLKKTGVNKTKRKSRLVTSDYVKDFELDTIKKDSDYLKNLNRTYISPKVITSSEPLKVQNAYSEAENEAENEAGNASFWQKKITTPNYSESRKALLDVKNWIREGEMQQKIKYEDPEIDSVLKRPMFRISVSAGLSEIASSESAIQKTRENEALTTNLMLGLETDIYLSEYLGANLEFGYGLSPRNIIVNGNIEKEKSIQHLSLFGGAVGKVTMPMQHFIFIPKIMLGYGALGLLEEVDSEKSTLLTRGPFIGFGAEVSLNSGISFGLDYYSSFSALSEGGNLSSTDSSLKRLSIFAMLKIFNGVSLGIRYSNRQMALENRIETMQQLLGLVSFEF